MMKIKYLLLFVICILHLPAFAQLQNVNVSNDVLFDGEPFLAVNPTNAQNMVIAWMGVTITGGIRISIKSKATFDGGQTWGNYVVHPHYTPTCGSADVSMSFRNDGTLYMSYIDFNQAADSGVIYLSTSADGGKTWTSPVVAWNIKEDAAKDPIDRPWLVADNSGTANNGMLYITTKPAYWIPPPNRPYLKTSSDSGQTWSAYRYVDSMGYLVGGIIVQPMGAPAVTADGALCIAYPSYDLAQSIYTKIFLAKSYNRGAGFQYYQVISNPVAVQDTNYKLGYRLAANPANASQLAFAAVGAQYGDPDIFVYTTNDGGQTWGNAVRVNDDSIGNGKAQDMVWISYNESGDLAAVWRDRRNGADTGFFQASDTYCAVSHDNGATFSKNFPLTTVTAPFDSVLLDKGNDFMCNHLIGDSISAAWGDVRSGKLNIYFAKTSDSTGQATGIISVNTEDSFDFEVYPNPATNTLTVKLPFSVYGLQLTLKLTDAIGKLIHEEKIQTDKTTLDVHNLAKGTYFISFEGDGVSLGKKVVKVNK